MGSTEAINGDSHLTRLSEFLKSYPDVKYLRLVTVGYAGGQQIKCITIHQARNIAASSGHTLRPGEEVPSNEKGGLITQGEAGDERGVVVGAMSHIACVFLVVDDTGSLSFSGIEEGDMFIQIDWTTLLPLLHEPSYAYVSVSLYHRNGGKALGYGYDRDPRVLLRRTVDRAKDRQMEFQVGMEIEFTLFDEKDVTQPLQDPRTTLYGNLHGSRGLKIVADMVDTLEYAGVHVWSFHPEDGNQGVYEIQLSATTPLDQADKAAFAAHVIRDIATKHGCIATMAAAPVAGSTIGRHFHLSLSRPDEGMHFVGGLMEHMPELFTLLHSSIDGYEVRKFHGGGKYIYWGDNKGAPINVKYPGRIELRMGDCHFNIYLQLAAIISAGMDGVERQVVPQQKKPVHFPTLLKYAFAKPDTVIKEETPSKHDIDHIPLPKDLGEAIEKFKEKKEFWNEALSEKCVDGIVLVQEGKWNKRHDMTKEERRVKTVQKFA